MMALTGRATAPLVCNPCRDGGNRSPAKTPGSGHCDALCVCPAGLPMEDLVIYEMHVRGFTASGPPGVDNPGTYQGLTQRLDYLTSLGVNAIELLPIHEFNELEYYQVTAPTSLVIDLPLCAPPVLPEINFSALLLTPAPQRRLQLMTRVLAPMQIEPEAPARYNFWGYSTCGFFSPMLRYSAAAASSGSAQEVSRAQGVVSNVLAWPVALDRSSLQGGMGC